MEEQKTVKKWSRNYDRCLACGSDKNMHAANGICIMCYRREKSAQWREKKRAEGTFSEYTKRWQENIKKKNSK